MKTNDESWNVARSAEHYGIHEWGNGYFDIGEQGDVTVLDPAHPGMPGVSLAEIAAAARERELDMPLLLRVENVLEHRIRALNEAFSSAIEKGGYDNVYRGVFPIKVNQQHHVIEEIARCGAPFHHGFEAGSKAELVIALTSRTDPESLIVCNGYKDEEFIRLGLFAVRLGIRCFFVVEHPGEIPVILEQASLLGVRPLIGVRLKLSTRVDGHWKEDSGDRSIFGLSTAQLIEVVDALKAADSLDCLQLMHVHIGSQIPNIGNVRTGATQACRYYADLVREGAPMGFLDMGGGLAVDYDGSASNGTHSMNYGLDEYCLDLVEALVEGLSSFDIPHPVLITESGRATVAYSSVLLFDVLDVSRVEPSPTLETDEDVAQIVTLEKIAASVDANNLQESCNDANHYRDEMRQRFRRGEVTLRSLAVAENVHGRIVQRIVSLLPSARRVPHELQALPDTMADIYYGNFSVFQSLPDAWAIDQVFPVMPIHRLDERPTRRAVIADITCDSDGRLARFADPESEHPTLALHAPRGEEPYHLGVFLVGAYQETLGDLHNLFGDTNVATVRLHPGGGFDVEHELAGDTIADVLSYVEYDPQRVAGQFRDLAEQAVRDGRVSVAERQVMIRAFAESLAGYTYFER